MFWKIAFSLNILSFIACSFTLAAKKVHVPTDLIWPLLLLGAMAFCIIKIEEKARGHK